MVIFDYDNSSNQVHSLLFFVSTLNRKNWPRTRKLRRRRRAALVKTGFFIYDCLHFFLYVSRKEWEKYLSPK